MIKDGRLPRPLASLTSTERTPMSAIDYFSNTDTVHIATELRDGARS
jgi:hypothetical protein